MDPITFAGISAGTKVLVETVLIPLAKEAGGDFYKDFLKDNASNALYEKVPGLLKKLIDHSHKDFLDLFREELEYCGLPGELIQHEFAEPLGKLLKDTEVKRFLGEAFDFETKSLDGVFLQDKWAQLNNTSLPKAFDWEQLTKNYLRKVKGLIREDTELSRQLELNYHERVKENTDELVGVKVGFDLEEYQESLKEKYGRLSLDSLDTTGAAYDNLKLWNIFVAQDVRECAEFAPQMYELPKERLVELQEAGEIDPLISLDTLERQRRSYAEKPIESVRDVVGLETSQSVNRVVVLGDPGSGKSTLLRAIALEWTEKSIAELKNEPIPLLIELRLYAQDKKAGVCNDFLEYLHKGNTPCRLNQLEVDELLKSGKAVALFDGVDEVFDPKLREAVVTDIHRFSNSYSQVQIVVTSRWLGYKAETLRNADFKQYMLQDLNEEQITDFVKRWHTLTFKARQAEEKERKQNRLHKAIRESKAIRELAGNPLLLTMMAILNRNQELPRDRARLYERASEVLLYQWDVEEKLHEQPELKNWQIDAYDKQEMLQKVAHHMQSNKDGLSGNVISRQDLEKILTAYLNTLEVDRARAVAKIMIEQLRERNFILCYLGANNYAFVHRTFLEYFCAREFVRKFEKENTIALEELNSLYREHFSEESWDEVLRLIAGMVEPNVVGKIIEHLLAQRVNWDEFSFFNDDLFGTTVYLKQTGLANLLLAANCFAEVRVRSKISTITNRLLEKLKQIADNSYPYVLDNSAATALIQSIAVNWAEKDDTLAWLKSCLSLSNPSIAAAAVEAIVRGWKDHPETLGFIRFCAQNGESKEVRCIAVQELARGWKNNSETLSWLKDSAQKDDSDAGRSAAVQEVARGWKNNSDTLSWLKFRARSDQHHTVRSTAINEIARGWHDEPDTLAWLKSRADDYSDAVRSAVVHEVARGWNDDHSTLDWLTSLYQSDNHHDVRSTAIQELSRGWQDDPDTLSRLKSCARDDDHHAVRSAAIQELARGWKNDSDTLTILKSRAYHDENYAVRITAIQELIKGWKGDTDTLTILKSHARTDEHYAVRRSAAQELAKEWKDDLDTLTILRSCAQSDDSDAVRSIAVQELAKNWRDNPTTLAVLNSCIRDISHNVRRVAVQELARGWKSQPDTLLTLQSYAEEDEHYSVRNAAVQELARGWKNNSKTLTILESTARNDGHDAVRSAAIQELARGWRKNTKLFDFWCDRALHDQFKRDYDLQENPRQIALKVLTIQYPNDPKTGELLQDVAKNDDDDKLRAWATKQLREREKARP